MADLSSLTREQLLERKQLLERRKELMSQQSKQPEQKQDLTSILSSSKKLRPTGDPRIDSLIFAQKEIFGPLVQAMNTATFGVPKFVANKIDPEYAKQVFAEQSTTPAKIARGAGEVGAYLFGGAAKLSAKAAEKVAAKIGTKVASKVARGTIKGAVQGATYGASQLTGNATLKGQAEHAATGALIGGILGAIPRLINLKGSKAGEAIAKRATKGIDELSDELSNQYDELFANIKGGSSTTDDLVNQIDEIINQYPEGEGISTLKKIKTRLLPEPPEPGNIIMPKGGKTPEQPIVPKTITAEELHNLKQEVRKLIPDNVWKGKAEANAMQNANRGLYFKITEKLGKIGGEEYKGLSQEYRNLKRAVYRSKKILQNEGEPSNMNLTRRIDEPLKRHLKYLDKRAKDKFLEDLMAYRRGQSIKKFFKNPINDALIGYSLSSLLRGRR